VVFTVLVVLVVSHGLFTGTLTWLTRGQTFGKAFTGLIERERDGSPLPMTPRSLVRTVARHSFGYAVIDMFGIGVLTSFGSPRRRCAHDVVFGTEVVAIDAAARKRDRVRQLNVAREAGLDHVKQGWGWGHALMKWTSGIATKTAGSVAYLARAFRLVSPVSAPVSTALVSQAPAGIALSGIATAGVAAGTAVVTTATGVALSPQIASHHVTVNVPSSGLVAAFVADTGITLDDEDHVQSWTDQTGNLELKPQGDGDLPDHVHNPATGHNVVHFDWGGSVSMAGPARMLPSGDSPRTVIIAARWPSDPTCISSAAWFGTVGAGWGDPNTANGSFFTGNTDSGELAVFDEPACTPQSRELVSPDTTIAGDKLTMVAATADGDQMALHLRGTPVFRGEYRFLDTQPRLMWIGAWPHNYRAHDSDVAAVFIYKRVLHQAEITAIADYLRTHLDVDA
jgi:RDD family